MVHQTADLRAVGLEGGREAALQEPEREPLGSHEGLCGESRFRDPRTGCKRWPEGLWLLSSQGEVVRGRCKATNLCEYCAIQAAHENARMLSLDAIDGQAATVLLILGTRTATADPQPFYNGRREVVRSLRERFGRQVEYASLCEFTTGMGPRSGGLRRPHWNVFVKGLPTDRLDEIRDLVRERWCAFVDAEPQAQYVEQLRDAGAAANYVAMHFQKESQAPPVGWRGQRFNCSRAFFGERTRAEMRQAARESLQLDRELFKARRSGLVGEAAQAAAQEALEARSLLTWGVWWQDLKRACSNPPAAHGSAELRRGPPVEAWPG